jgi:hypothetical protein
MNAGARRITAFLEKVERSMRAAMAMECDRALRFALYRSLL